MSDAFTGASALSSDQAAFERMAWFSFRPQLYFDQVAAVRATNQTQPGTSVTFTIYADLDTATTALSETTDVTAVALSDSQVTLTPAEYGNAVVTTAKLRATSMFNVDTDAANIVGFNAGSSVDELARDALAAGTNVVYATGGSTDPTSRATVESEDVIALSDVRKVVAQLRTANVPDLGGFYVGHIHPNVSYDFRSATGAGTWRAPKEYIDTAGVYTGEIGSIEGVRFVETPRAKTWTSSGSGSINVYSTHITGFQGLGKAVCVNGEYGEQPSLVFGPVIDRLQRLHPIGWKHFVAYGIIRQAAVRRIESSSSLG